MLAQDAFIFRLLLKMTVGKGHSGNHYFWRARAQTFIVTPWRALPIADRPLPIADRPIAGRPLPIADRPLPIADRALGSGVGPVPASCVPVMPGLAEGLVGTRSPHRASL